VIELMDTIRQKNHGEIVSEKNSSHEVD